MRFDLVQKYGVAVLGAVVVHAVLLAVLAYSISFRLGEPEVVEPQIVAVALPPPPPPDVERLAPTDAIASMVPRFRPREPLGVNPEARQRFGNPALAVWRYLCNRDMALSDAAQRDCPDSFGSVDIGVLDPLNRQGDAGIMLGADTSTMSLEEAGRHKRWVKPKAALPAEGARAKPDELGLPGHDPFDILPKN